MCVPILTNSLDAPSLPDLNHSGLILSHELSTRIGSAGASPSRVRSASSDRDVRKLLVPVRLCLIGLSDCQYRVLIENPPGKLNPRGQSSFSQAVRHGQSGQPADIRRTSQFRTDKSPRPLRKALDDRTCFRIERRCHDGVVVRHRLIHGPLNLDSNPQSVDIVFRGDEQIGETTPTVFRSRQFPHLLARHKRLKQGRHLARDNRSRHNGIGEIR